MKRSIFSIALALGLVGSAVAATSPIYRNDGVVLEYTPIDALAFDNHGTFEPSLSSSSTGSSSGGGLGVTYFIWDSQNTRYFTNSGIMGASLGFRFDTLAPSRGMYMHRPAEVFTNSGIIFSDDILTSVSSSSASYYEGYGSYIMASAKSIGNSGIMSVGDIGLLRLSGQKIDLRDGALTAGYFGDSTRRVGRGSYGTNQYYNVTDVSDLYWGASTNRMDLTQYLTGEYGDGGWLPQTPSERVTGASTVIVGGTSTSAGTVTTTFSLPQYSGSFGAWVYTNVVSETNHYVNIVFVRTNGLDPSVSLGVRFYKGTPRGITGTNYDRNTMQAVIGFSLPVPDIITGGETTSSFYLIDSGAGQNPITLYTNLGYPTFKPSCFEITTIAPSPEWANGTNGNAVYTPSLIYPGNTYTNKEVNYQYGAYVAQVGRNSEVSSGSYLDSSGLLYSTLYTTGVLGNDPSNGTARIEINANNLDLSRARIRTEGFLSLRATNITASEPVAIDAGAMNIDLGSTNGFLSISNVLPSIRTRAAGNIYAWAANWTQYETNASQTDTNSSGSDTNSTTTNAAATVYKFHVLVVDYSLQSQQRPTIEDLTLRGKKIYVQDYLRAINTMLIDTEDLEINSPVSYYQSGGDYGGNLGATNFPKLKKLQIDPSGYLVAGNRLLLGWDTPTGLTSLTNNGIIESATVKIKSGALENRGTIYSQYNGLYLDTKTLNLRNRAVASEYGDETSTLQAGLDVEIHAGRLLAQGSLISGGTYAGGKLSLWVTNELSDGISSLPSAVPTLTNFWYAQNGFRLMSKPYTGDLFGTELISTVTNFQRADHVWAAEDRGATMAGFVNNAVIGHLVLGAQGPGGYFHFSGVGARSAMYVDFLEFRYDAVDNYASALAIDRNMTIYYAASNLDPSLLQSVYSNRLVWVPEFVGPNSTKLVDARMNGQTNSVLCNLSLAKSTTIDSDGDGIVNGADSFPVDGSVLSIKIVGSGTVSPNANGRALMLGQKYTAMAVPNPGNLFVGWSWENATPALVADAKQANISFTMQSNLVLTANFIPDPAVLRVSITGNGTVAPVTNQRLVYGKTYTLTATPAAGNLFRGWSGGIESAARTIHFVMHSNLELHATFETNNLPNYKGQYNGLFYVNNDGATFSASNDVALASSGSFRLTVTDTGIASGKLYMSANPSGYPFTTTVAQDGKAQVLVKRAGKSSLVLQFQINVGATNEISGQVIEGESWTASLLGDRVTYSASSKAPMAGSYRVALKGMGLGETGPLGDGYGTVTISALGEVALSFNLPDGTSVSQAALIGKNGRWPLYATRVGKDSLLGWITISTNTATMSGNVKWIKQSGATRYYSTGFNETFEFVGSRYTIPTDRSGGLALRSPILVLHGDAAVAGSYVLSFVPGTTTLTSADKSVSVVLAPRTGTFSGKVIDRNTRVAKPFSGVLLQVQNEGLGCFYSAGSSGEARLQNNE